MYQAAGESAAGAEELQQQAERKRGETAIPGLQQAAVGCRLAAADFECASDALPGLVCTDPLMHMHSLA